MRSELKSVRFFDRFDRKSVHFFFLRHALPHTSAVTASIFNLIAPNIPPEHWLRRGNGRFEQFVRLHEKKKHGKTPVPGKKSVPRFAKTSFFMATLGCRGPPPAVAAFFTPSFPSELIESCRRAYLWSTALKITHLCACVSACDVVVSST